MERYAPGFSAPPPGKSGMPTRSSFASRVGEPEVVGEEPQCVLGRVQRVGGEVTLPWSVYYANRRPARVHRLGDLERSDDERHEVRRHLHGGKEMDLALYPAILVTRRTSSATGAFETAVKFSSTTNVISKVALRSGSSQQGNVRRALARNIVVVPMVRTVPSTSLKVEQ